MTVTRKRLLPVSVPEEKRQKKCDDDYLPSADEEEEEEMEPPKKAPPRGRRGGRSKPKKSNPSKQGTSFMLIDAIHAGRVANGQWCTSVAQVVEGEFVTINLRLCFYYQQRVNESQKLCIELWPLGETPMTGGEKPEPIISSAFINLVHNVWLQELQSHIHATGWACSSTGRYNVYAPLHARFQRKGHPSITKDVPLIVLNSIDLQDWEPCLTQPAPAHQSYQNYAKDTLQPAMPLVVEEEEEEESSSEEEEEEEDMEVEQQPIGPNRQLLQKHNLLPPIPSSLTTLMETAMEQEQLNDATQQIIDSMLSTATPAPPKFHESKSGDEEEQQSDDDEQEEELVVEAEEEEWFESYIQRMNDDVGREENLQLYLQELNADPLLSVEKEEASQFDCTDIGSFEHDSTTLEWSSGDLCV